MWLLLWDRSKRKVRRLAREIRVDSAAAEMPSPLKDEAEGKGKLARVEVS